MQKPSKFRPVQEVSSQQPNYIQADGVSNLKWQSSEMFTQQKLSEVSKQKPQKVISRGIGIFVKNKHSVVETQTLYFTDLNSGKCGFIQLLYSSVMKGLYQTFQLNFKICCSDDDKKELDTWESFKLDGIELFTDLKLQSKNVTFEFKESTSAGTTLSIVSTLSTSGESRLLHINLHVKLGMSIQIGPDGCSYFSNKPSKTPQESKKRLRHVFVPQAICDGTLKYIKNGQLTEIHLQGVPSILIGALHTLNPIKAACRWNFAVIQTQNNCGICMEYTTPPDFGSVTVTISIFGSRNESPTVYASSVPTNKHVTFLATANDAKNKWDYPTAIRMPLGHTNFLVEDRLRMVNKYDILSELPRIVKSTVENIAGLKPCIYQYCQRTRLADEDGIAIIESTFIT